MEMVGEQSFKTLAYLRDIQSFSSQKHSKKRSIDKDALIFEFVFLDSFDLFLSLVIELRVLLHHLDGCSPNDNWESILNSFSSIDHEHTIAQLSQLLNRLVNLLEAFVFQSAVQNLEQFLLPESDFVIAPLYFFTII